MTSDAHSSAPVRSFFELLRPANVVTAVADVLAGAAVAGAAWSRHFWWLVPSTACLYAGGVVLNDYFDRHVDAIERPERPIPSGRVTARAAATLGALLLLAGVAFAAGSRGSSAAMAGAVALAVLLYDARGKRHAFLGPVNMGACRALNLLLGMTAASGAVAAAWPLALLPLTYIAGVTVLSRGEVAGGKRPVALLALALVGLVAVAAIALAARPTDRVALAWAVILAAGFAIRLLPAFWRAWRDPSPATIRTAVRTGVLSLVLLDAVIAAAYADIMVSLAVLATAVLAGRLARLFAVT
jgi:4-hydroxybenzoate polyprenyltransferase